MNYSGQKLNHTPARSRRGKIEQIGRKHSLNSNLRKTYLHQNNFSFIFQIWKKIFIFVRASKLYGNVLPKNTAH